MKILLPLIALAIMYAACVDEPVSPNPANNPIKRSASFQIDGETVICDTAQQYYCDRSSNFINCHMWDRFSGKGIELNVKGISSGLRTIGTTGNSANYRNHACLSGEIDITEIDTTKGLISGTFHAIAWDSTRIDNGKFQNMRINVNP